MAKKKNSTTTKIKELKGEMIDLAQPTQITEEELAQLQSSIKTIDNLTGEVGSIEVRKHSLMRAMESVHSRLEALRVKLQKEYGTDNISIQDGSITYANQTPSENGQAN